MFTGTGMATFQVSFAAAVNVTVTAGPPPPSGGPAGGAYVKVEKRRVGIWNTATRSEH